MLFDTLDLQRQYELRRRDAEIGTAIARRHTLCMESMADRPSSGGTVIILCVGPWARKLDGRAVGVVYSE